MDNPNNVTAQAVLDRLLERAKKGELADVVVVFETKDGDTGVQASSMGIVQANHLWRVFDDRVRAMYREVRLRASKPRSPTAGVTANGPKAAAAAAIPRQVRRAVQKQQRKLAKKAARAAATRPPEPKSPPPPAGNSH